MDTNRIPKQALQYKPKDEGTKDDRGRDGGTNFILKIEEQETHLILHEHGEDDDELMNHFSQGDHVKFRRIVTNVAIDIFNATFLCY
jgi:hypothetical protein